MSNQTAAVVAAIATSVNWERKGINLQAIIMAANQGKLGGPLTDWLVAQSWNDEVPTRTGTAELAITAAKAGWELTDFTTLTQSEEKCRKVLAYLRGEAKLVADIFRLYQPFNHIFVGQRWKRIAEETDMGAEALTELDLGKVRFVTTLKNGESCISGEERLKRLKEDGQVHLGGKAFMACWNNRHLLPESWKKDEGGNTRHITFDGLTLEDPNGYRCVLYLYWADREWQWDYFWLGSGFSTHRQSASLAS